MTKLKTCKVGHNSLDLYTVLVLVWFTTIKTELDIHCKKGCERIASSLLNQYQETRKYFDRNIKFAWSLVPNHPFRNGTLSIALKNWAKADIKTFWSCTIFTWFLYFDPNILSSIVCVISVQIRGFSGPYFPAFGPEKTPYLDKTFWSCTIFTWFLYFDPNILSSIVCVISVQIRGFSGPYFPAFGPEKTPYLDTFHAVRAATVFCFPDNFSVSNLFTEYFQVSASDNNFQRTLMLTFH